MSTEEPTNKRPRADAHIEPLPRKERTRATTTPAVIAFNVNASVEPGNYVLICHTGGITNIGSSPVWVSDMDAARNHLGLALERSYNNTALKVAERVHSAICYHYKRQYLTRVWACDVDEDTRAELLDHNETSVSVAATALEQTEGDMPAMNAALDAVVLTTLRANLALRTALAAPNAFFPVSIVAPLDRGQAFLVGNHNVVLFADYSYTVLLGNAAPTPPNATLFTEDARRVLTAVLERWRRLVATLPPLTAAEEVAPPLALAAPVAAADARTPPTCHACHEFLLEPMAFPACTHHACADCTSVLGAWGGARAPTHNRSGAGGER